jgi:hypothetical protein
MYDFDGGRHWSDVSYDDGTSDIGAFCMVDLDRDKHRSDVHGGGCGDYEVICMAFLDGVWHRNETYYTST